MNGSIDYVGALRRNLVIAAAVAAVAIFVTLIVTAMQTRIYEASAQLVVAPSPQMTDPADVIRSVETLERRTVVATFARIASSAEIRSAAAKQAGISEENAALIEIHGAVVPSTNVIRIEASGSDPAQVAALANAAAEATAQRAQLLYRVYTLRFLSQAGTPTVASYPDTRRNLLVGITLALFLGLLSALAADRLRPLYFPGREQAS